MGILRCLNPSGPSESFYFSLPKTDAFLRCVPCRHPGVIPDSQKAAAAVARSFSLSWRNQGDQGAHAGQEPMRIRSATTSGAPGVEKARNNVRQKASGESSSNVLRTHTEHGKHCGCCRCQRMYTAP